MSETDVCPVSGLTLDEAAAFLAGVRARRACGLGERPTAAEPRRRRRTSATVSEAAGGVTMATGAAEWGRAGEPGVLLGCGSDFTSKTGESEDRRSADRRLLYIDVYICIIYG